MGTRDFPAQSRRTRTFAGALLISSSAFQGAWVALLLNIDAEPVTIAEDFSGPDIQGGRLVSPLRYYYVIGGFLGSLPLIILLLTFGVLIMLSTARFTRVATRCVALFGAIFCGVALLWGLSGSGLASREVWLSDRGWPAVINDFLLILQLVILLTAAGLLKTRSTGSSQEGK